MKKLLCFLLCLTLIFSSVSFCFASATQWDTSDQANLRYIYQTLTSGSMYTLVNNIYSRMNTINNSIQDLADFLVYNGDTITEWVYSIDTWMSPIFNAINSIPTDISTIIGALGYFTDNGTTYHPYLNDLHKALTNSHNGDNWTDVTNITVREFAHRQLITDNTTGSYNFFNFLPSGNYNVGIRKWGLGTPIGNLALIINGLNTNFVYLSNLLVGGFSNSQTITNWSDLSTSSYTPNSVVTGLYHLLENIQTPTARLSYVLASDERIAAQEAAAANEEAVVDNFIDSSGDGATSPSDIGSISGLSSGYKQNFGTDASPSGIFDIFNSDHATWFSQETKNQLDTTTPSRMTKGSVSETPLLDKQIEDIYNALGVKQP